MSQNLDVDVNPDVIFTSSLLNSFPKNNYASILSDSDFFSRPTHSKNSIKSILKRFKGSSDCVNAIGITDNVLNPNIGFSPKTGSPSVYLAKLCSYSRLCIGRFHAAIAALVLEIPFSAWPSNTKKIDYLMQDLDLAEYFYPTFELALNNCPSSFPLEVRPKVLEYQKQINAMFDKIAGISL